MNPVVHSGNQPTSPVEASQAAVEAVWSSVSGDADTTLVDSPPGAGKSTLVREMAWRLVRNSGQVPLIVQTNNQADDMVEGLVADMTRSGRELRVARLHKDGYPLPGWMRGRSEILAGTRVSALDEAHIIVGTAAKWAGADSGHWPISIIDEAYQMRSAALLPIGSFTDRLLAVGDPGQVDPFTPADEGHFKSMPLSPVEAAAVTLSKTRPDAIKIALPVSWRLRPEAAQLVSGAFYRESFVSGSTSAERRLNVGTQLIRAPFRQAVSTAAETGWAHLVLPARVMPAHDPELAEMIAGQVLALLDAAITLPSQQGERPLLAERIAVGTAHHSQVDAVRRALSALCEERGIAFPPVWIDTANALQGREFDVTLVWHPLSGRRDASQFHLDPGRLCVLLSRHRNACFVFSRDGIEDQLLHTPTNDNHYPGADVLIDGWFAQSEALNALAPYRVIAG